MSRTNGAMPLLTAAAAGALATLAVAYALAGQWFETVVAAVLALMLARIAARQDRQHQARHARQPNNDTTQEQR